MLGALRRFHYDTVVFDPAVLRALVDFAGPERVLLGSDYPFDMGDDRPADVVRAAGLASADEAAILGGNARRLLGDSLPTIWPEHRSLGRDGRVWAFPVAQVGEDSSDDRDSAKPDTADRCRARAVSAAAGIDQRLGPAVGHAVRAHHRRRLGRIGQLGALTAEAGGWAAGEPAPRAGCSLEVLIDGAEALPRIASELEQAESHVHVAGWFLSPDFALTREGDLAIVRNVWRSSRKGSTSRVLLWAGAPLPLFRPSRSTVRKMRENLCRGTRIQCGLDSRERPMHCHHEKTIVLDDQVAFVGGIDLTAEAGDRFDSQSHPARGQVGWHDACARIGGPAVTDVARHFAMRWHEVTGETLPAPQPAEPRARSSCRSCGPCPRSSTAPCRAATSASSSRTFAHFVRRSG